MMIKRISTIAQTTVVLLFMLILAGCDKGEVITKAGKELTNEQATKLIREYETTIERLEAQNTELKSQSAEQIRMQEDVARLKSMLTPPDRKSNQ